MSMFGHLPADIRNLVSQLFPQHLFPDDFVQGVNKLIELGKKGEKVKHWNDIQQMFQNQGLLATGVQMPVDNVGVSPDNRSGLGLVAQLCHSHGDEVIQAGFTFPKCADATAVQCPPGMLAKPLIGFNANVCLPMYLQALMATLKLISLSSMPTPACQCTQQH